MQAKNIRELDNIWTARLKLMGKRKRNNWELIGQWIDESINTAPDIHAEERPKYYEGARNGIQFAHRLARTGKTIEEYRAFYDLGEADLTSTIDALTGHVNDQIDAAENISCWPVVAGIGFLVLGYVGWLAVGVEEAIALGLGGGFFTGMSALTAEAKLDAGVNVASLERNLADLRHLDERLAQLQQEAVHNRTAGKVLDILVATDEDLKRELQIYGNDPERRKHIRDRFVYRMNDALYEESGNRKKLALGKSGLITFPLAPDYRTPQLVQFLVSLKLPGFANLAVDLCQARNEITNRSIAQSRTRSELVVNGFARMNTPLLTRQKVDYYT